jgi:hypothetical protein
VVAQGSGDVIRGGSGGGGKGVRVVEHADKTAFSMWIPEISRHFEGKEKGEIVIVGVSGNGRGKRGQGSRADMR